MWEDEVFLNSLVVSGLSHFRSGAVVLECLFVFFFFPLSFLEGMEGMRLLVFGTDSAAQSGRRSLFVVTVSRCRSAERPACHVTKAGLM